MPVQVEVVAPLGHVPIVWQDKELADLDMCTAAVRVAALIHKTNAPTGDILVFLPTPHDVQRCVDLMEGQKLGDRQGPSALSQVQVSSRQEGAGGGPRTEVWGQQKQSNDPCNNQHNPNTPTTGRR